MAKDTARTIDEGQRDAFRRIRESARNIVFLDIDGALNNLRSKERNPSGYIGIDDDKVRILRLKQYILNQGKK